MADFLKKLWRDDGGQDLMEYALILVLISLVALAILQVIGATVHNIYSTASSNLTAAES
jgi:Flp pilus assembly pilin Flp